MAKTEADREATVKCTCLTHRGPEGGMHEQTDSLNWGPTRRPSDPRTKKISRGLATSGSDEAIVSDDLTGHYNRSASQGPLDESVREESAATPQGACPQGPQAAPNGLASRISWGIPPAKVATDFSFEAVLGKTRRTEFQRGLWKHEDVFPDILPCASSLLDGSLPSLFLLCGS